MRRLTYLAVFEPYDGGFSVYYPDLPGCVSYGDGFEHAQKMAREALDLHIYGMEKDGDDIPQPNEAAHLDIYE